MQDQSLTIRHAEETDRNEVIRLFRQYGYDETSVESWADHCIRQEQTAMFLAIAGNYALAFARVTLFEYTAHIYDLYTDPAFQRCGIAGHVMQFCEDWAQGQGFQTVQLHVYEENYGAQGLYKKRGYANAFNTVSVGDCAPQAPETHHLMVKHLNGPA